MARFCQSYIPYDKDTDKFKFVLECSKLAIKHLHGLGHSIALYTNAEGERLFNDCGYDDIVVVNYDNSLNEREFFASIKFIAYENEPLSTIFIDNDVIIVKNDCVEKIFNFKSDLVCQRVDIDYDGYNRFREFLMPVIKSKFKVDGLMSASNNGLNCGLVKFNNQLLKDKYLFDRKALVNLILNDGIFKRFYADKTFNYEIIIEQWYLLNLCITEGFSYKTISRPYDDHFNDTLGYYHFIGRYGDKRVEFLQSNYHNRINTVQND